MKKAPDILRQFGARVREERTARKISQEAFAQTCGLDRTYISGIERGKRNVGLRNIESIANALELTVSELTKGI